MFKKTIKVAVLGMLVGALTMISAADAKIHKYGMRDTRHHSTMRVASHFKLPPFAYIQFCVHHRSACANRAGKLKMVSRNRVRLNKHLSAQLAHINARVNARMKARSDKGADSWKVGGRYGDCEDYALTKRSMLLAAGWPSRALSLTVVKTAWGEGHAVLSVRTSAGTMVLDNLTRAVKSIKRVSYRIVSVQGMNPMHWTAGL